MLRYSCLFLALLGGAACAQTPEQLMQQSAAATYQQQQFQQQQLMNQIQHNLTHCGDAHGYGCRQPQQAVDNSRPAEWTMTGLADSYGGIAVAYKNDIIRDNYANPLPFSWEAYRDQTAEIDGMAMNEVSPIGSGSYLPYVVFSAGTFRNQPGSEADVHAKLREECGGDACTTAAVYRNTCNAVAVGWLTDYSGVRIYTARQAHHGNTAYGKWWPPPSRMPSAAARAIPLSWRRAALPAPPKSRHITAPCRTTSANTANPTLNNGHTP